MGVPERKKRETEALRERVLDVAEEIFATEGARQVTMRRIASSIEYAPTVLYRLFANKNDLMGHLIARGYGGVRERYKEVLSHEDLEPLQALAALLTAYCNYALNHPNHYQMWFETGEIELEDDQIMMRHGRLEFVAFQPWLDCIDACRDAGLFPDRERLQIFQILWSRVHGWISLRLQHPDFPWLRSEEHLDEVLDLPGMARE